MISISLQSSLNFSLSSLFLPSYSQLLPLLICTFTSLLVILLSLFISLLCGEYILSRELLQSTQTMSSMAHSSLQVCMDSSDWLQGTMSEDISTGLDSSSSPSGGDCMLAAACSSRAGGGPAPLMERRLRPQHDQNLKCPRCDSTHTKFCYYNNYSLSQPRYFCKTCRRYWTKGGTLRNIPVGGGCRKNKKSSSKKSSSSSVDQGSITAIGSNSATNPTDLHLSTFPPLQIPPHLASLIGAHMSLAGGGPGADFMEGGGGGGLIRPIDFLGPESMESKYEALVGRGHHDFLGAGINGGGGGGGGGDQFGVVLGGYNNGGMSVSGGIPFGGVGGGDMIHSEGNYNSNGGGISFMDQRLLLPFDHHGNHHHDQHDHDHHQSGHLGLMDVKPNPKLLSLEWQDHGNKETSSFGYNVNAGPWTGMMAGFQPSTTNSLV